MEYNFNKYQTVLTPELLDSLPKEVRNDLIETLESIKFVQWLVSSETVRGYAKDKKRWDTPNLLDSRVEDPNGRIYVDITKPHILEDTNFFRERAIYFQKYGVYTNIPPTPNPKSAYAEFWKEELRRWKYGLVRPSDGEWITGYHYFYLNYVHMLINEEDDSKNTGKKKRKVRGTRKREFPDFWLGDYLWFHYMEQARDNGEHCKLLKKRGCGFSWKFGGITPCTMYTQPGLPNFHLASDKGYLEGDKGVFGKVVDVLDWIAESTPLPKLKLVDKPLEKVIGYKDAVGTRKGLLSSVFGISLKDDPDKARGLRGPIIHYEEDGVFDNLEDAWNVNLEATEEGGIVFGTQIAGGCVCAGTKVWTKDGRYINVEDLKQEDGIIGFDLDKNAISHQDISYIQPPIEKDCVEIKTSRRTLRCSIDHPILTRFRYFKNTNEVIGTRRDYYKKLDKWYETPRHKSEGVYERKWIAASNLKKGNYIYVAEFVDTWGTETLFDARLVGMLIGDGSYGLRKHYNKIEYKTPAFSNCDVELVSYVLNNYSCNIEIQRPTKDGRLYHEISIRGLVQKLKDIGIAGQSKDKKRLPTNYLNLTKRDTCLLIAGLFDTDGCVRIDKYGKSITITQSAKELLEQLKILLEKLGIFSTIRKVEPRIASNRKDKNPWYVLSIQDNKSYINFYNNIPLMIKYKRNNLQKSIDSLEGFRHRKYGIFENCIEEKILSIESIGRNPIYNLTADGNNNYLANNIITHNTGGTSGANFIGSEKLFYNPEAYNIYGIPNVFDKNISGNTKCGFFWGAYMNRARCYDKDSGEPNVIAALIEILEDRYRIKTSSPDTTALTQKKAEQPLTPQDAVMRIEGSIFPVGDLKEYLADISPELSNFVSTHYIGDIVYNSNGELIFKFNDSKSPLREFPIENNLNKEGAIEIFELPQRDGENKIARLRYIAGCLTPGEKVVTDKGLKNVEDVTLEDTLINENGDIVNINKLLRYNVLDEDTYRIKLSNTFRTTNFTKEHPLLVSEHKLGYVSLKKYQRLGISQRYHKFNFQYKTVDKINVGDWVRVPNTYLKQLDTNLDLYWVNDGYRIDRIIDNPLYNKDFWWLVGLWLGDGWCDNNTYKVSFACNCKENNYINRIKTISTNLFKRGYYSRLRKNCEEVTINFQQFNQFLTKNFNKYASGKRIPEWVKYLNKEFKIALIQGYLDSDGSITRKRGYYASEFVSINLELLESIQDILFSLGIVGSLCRLRKASVNQFDGYSSITKECYHLRVAHSDTLNLANIINDPDDHKLQRIDFINLPFVRRRPHDTCFMSDDLKYIYFRIMGIEKNYYSGIVYNFECNTHTFLCHHITTHNCDPVDDDSSTTNSLPSILILDRFTDRIVAEYTGRPKTAVEFYDTSIRLLEFYNATVNYECDKKGMFSHFSNKGKLHLLCETPKILKDKQLIKDTMLFGNKAFGTNSSKMVNAWGRRLQADWLIQPAYGEEETGKMNMHKIRSVAYLKELIAWNPDINADRVSAMGMLMIYREDLAKFEIRQYSKKIETKAQDKFFGRNQRYNFGYTTN